MKVSVRLAFVAISHVLIPFSLMGQSQMQVQSNGVVIVTVGKLKAVNEMAIYPQGGIPCRPLLVAAHGNGSSGPNEIEGWLALAKEHNFTVVCPTFLSGMSHSMYVPLDAPYFKDCLIWIQNNLRYSKSNVFMTGFSGGGYPVWYLGTTRPDFFRGLILQSGNFAGEYYDLNLSGWINKPICLVWGTQDLPAIIIQNHQATDLLKAKNMRNFATEIIPGAGHQPHHSLVVTWMEQETSSSSN